MSLDKDALIADLERRLDEAEENWHRTKDHANYLQEQADANYGLVEGRDAKISELERERDMEKNTIKELRESEKKANDSLEGMWEERDKVIDQLNAVTKDNAKIEEKLEKSEERAQQLESDLEKAQLWAAEDTPEFLRSGPTSEMVKNLEEEWEMRRATEDKPKTARLEQLEALVLELQTENEVHEAQIAADATEKERMKEAIESYQNQIESQEESFRFDLNSEACSDAQDGFDLDPKAFGEARDRFDLDPKTYSEARDPTDPSENWERRPSLGQELSIESDIEDQSDRGDTAGAVSDKNESTVPDRIHGIGPALRQPTWSHFATVNIDTYKYILHTITAIFRRSPSKPMTPSVSGLWHEARHPLDYPKPRPWPLLFDFFSQFILFYFFYLSWEVIREKSLWFEANDATRAYISDMYFSRKGRGMGFPEIVEGLSQQLVILLGIEIENYPMPG